MYHVTRGQAQGTVPTGGAVPSSKYLPLKADVGWGPCADLVAIRERNQIGRKTGLRKMDTLDGVGKKSHTKYIAETMP